MEIHPHHTDHPARKGMRPVVIGGIINLGLVVVKVGGGILGNSYALVADGIESATDILGSFILWFGLYLAAKAPDRDHPYGHGKAEPMAGGIVALALAAAGALIIIQSIINIRTPHKLPEPFTLWIIAGVVILKEGMYRYVKRVGERIKSQAVKADAWHHRSDAISSLAALVGIGLALLLGPGYEDLDDWAAIIASFVILYNAYRILVPAVKEMMDTAPDSEIIKNINAAAKVVPGVEAVEKCQVRKMGFEYYVDLHVEVDGDLTVYKGHDIAHKVKEAIIKANPSVYDVLVHIEPAPAR